MERGTMRLRMGVNDTHYAGNLVAGARIIELMDDAGTELPIMVGGDEGLLACWKHVEQYVPVYLGDYLEIKTWIRSVCPVNCIGNTTPRSIDTAHCLHCGNCLSICPVGAVERIGAASQATK